MHEISFREQGAGPTVILIHGFPMNLHVWDNFADKLSDALHVVTPDLPGFGKSPALPKGFSLEEVASVLSDWIAERKYSRPVIVGHSLGGYVALALAAGRRIDMAGLCLFHSTALADNDEKKQSRLKVLDFISSQGVQAFTSNFIGGLYADPRHHSVITVKNIAVQSSAEAVRGYTLAMKERPDRTGVLRSFPNPMLFLAGEKDPGIPVDSIRQQARLPARAETVVLPDAGHMGMFEAEAQCLKKILGFVKKCQVT